MKKIIKKYVSFVIIVQLSFMCISAYNMGNGNFILGLYFILMVIWLEIVLVNSQIKGNNK